MFDLSLLKNKNFMIACGISLAVLVLVVLLSPKKSVTQIPLSSPSTSSSRPELQNLSLKVRQDSAAYVTGSQDKLPINLADFVTSVGISTNIDIFRAEGDPPEVVRFEITGISYLGKDTSEFTNPNITAFKESFNKGLSLMKDKGLDPKKVIFIYGDANYVTEAASTWVDKLNLLK